MPETKPRVVLVANDPACLVPLCGVSTLERLLRILQRLGFRKATILASDPQSLRNAIEPRSWASRDIHVDVVPLATEIAARPLLRIPAELYCDARLIAALASCTTTTELIDSSRTLPLGSTSSGAMLVVNGGAATLDAAAQPAYVRSMRREIRPVFFRSPPAHLRPIAERVILDSAQNGTLDLPGLLESPIETAILRWLCKTQITPNQITALGIIVALVAAFLFARGQLMLGLIVALTIGVIDGLDGKQARAKIETTAAGKFEHALDFIVETILWAALAFWFRRSGQLPNAWLAFAIIVVAEIADQLAKRVAQKHIARLLDDHAPFDRLVRLIAARRGIYIWIVAAGVICGSAPRAYEFCAVWGLITAAVHAVRAVSISLREQPLRT